MTLVQNFPFFSIIIAMFSGILSCALSGKKPPSFASVWGQGRAIPI